MQMFVDPVLDRHQQFFLRETLEDSIGSDHPVRVFDFVLDQHDWKDWYARYGGGGRPAYRPDVMCKLLVYAYSIGIRSSRAIEHACLNSRDFLWLMQGLSPDHDTIAAFRREHGKEFKRVFRTSVAACVEAGMVSLKHMAVDGTRVKASNSRQQTRTAEQIEALLKQLDERIEKVVAEAETLDRKEDTLFGRQDSPHKLPKKLQHLKDRQAILRQAFEKVRARAEQARRHGDSEKDIAAKRVPVTDADSDVMKDKQGAFGPNYNPYVGVESSHQVIVSESVTSDHSDDGHLVSALEEAEQTTGQAIEQVLADSNYATPSNLTYCEEAGIDPCMAPYQSSLERSNPTPSPWPTDVSGQVAAADGSMVDVTGLPRDPQGRFEKSTFRYDAEQDVYLCPRGQILGPVGTQRRELKSGVVHYTVYQCRACVDCPLVSVCTRNKAGRSVKRGQHEKIHTRHLERMKDSQRRTDYRLRRQTVEPAIGILKHVLRLQQFLLRGLAGVRAEWSLACTAFNIRKLAKVLCPAGIRPALAVAAH